MPPRKRSRGQGGDSGAPAGKKSRVSWSRSVFGQMMEATGMKLGGGQHNQLSTEPALFQRRLGMSLKSQVNTDKAVRDFCEGLSEYCSDPLCFRVALLPTKIADGADISARSCGLDSVVRILLGVDCLQPVIITLLLDKLPQYTVSHHSSMCEQDLKQMPTLILNQLKMLDYLVEGKEFCKKFMEVMGVASPEVQSEMVTALPDIVDDPQHDDAAVLLKSLLSDTPSLTAPIMDALSNLIISNHIAAELLDVAMERLQTADMADLPTIIRFIMQYVTSKNAQEVISELRSKLTLDLSPLHPNILSSTPMDRHSAARKVSAELSSHFVVFDTIAATIHMHKPAADGWMKAIEAVVEPSDHRVIDVLVLFFLHSIGGRRKSVETMISAKIRGGCFNDDLLSAVLGSHAKALTEYFTSILHLCASLLCSLSPTVSSFAASLYRHLFAAFDSPYQQEVVGALVTHINNGSPVEVDHALSVLLDLVHQHFIAMQRFSILVKGVLDQLEYLTTPQIRQLYDILTVLGFTDPDRESAIQDEMRILIRKQLSHSEQRYRHMGVIGAVMCVKQLSQSSDHDQLISQGVHSTTRKQLAQSMLDEVMKTCGGSVDSMILFCEEIVGVVSSLDPETLTQLAEQVTSSFQDDYLIEASDPLSSGVELLYGLDTVEEGSIALNLLPLVSGGGCEGVRGLAARFHLLRVCEATVNQNLEGIDALLGCPVVLCSENKLQPESLEEMPLKERQEVCLSLFHTLNWFRELVCAFSHETDPDMKGKVLLRLTNITHVQGLLEKALANTLGWWPPSVNSWVPTHKPRKGKRNEVSLASITAATINVDSDTTADKNSTVNIDRVKPYFRELDLGVFRVLGFGVLSRTFLDSEEHTRVRDELRLRPPQVVFLLEDLYSKISSALSVFGSKIKGGNGGRFRIDDLVKLMVEMTPLLCDHLENTCAFFQAQLDDNDGILDMDCSHDDYPHHCLSLHLLLKSMATFLAWPHLTDPLHCEVLSTCMETLALRRQATPTGPTLPQLATDACKYFEKFVDVLPTLSCAHALGKLLVAVCKSSKATHIQPAIGQVCGDLLKRSWRVTEQTALRKEAIEYLLKYHLEWAGEPLVVIEQISGESAVELIGEEPVEASANYPTLTRGSFPWFHRVMMCTLVHHVKAIPVPKRSDSPSPEELDERLHTLEVSARVFFILVNLVKSFCKSAVLSSCLKSGRLYLDSVLKSGMPVLDSLFRARKDDVLALLKSLQQSTRWLQHYCGHSKVTRDTNLINNVPQLKKSLELFIFKVKELLSNHNCGDAFWLGTLKNRDITGREILSQQPTNEASDEEESGEEDAQSVTNSTSTDRTGDGLMDQVED